MAAGSTVTSQSVRPASSAVALLNGNVAGLIQYPPQIFIPFRGGGNENFATCNLECQESANHKKIHLRNCTSPKYVAKVVASASRQNAITTITISVLIWPLSNSSFLLSRHVTFEV